MSAMAEDRRLEGAIAAAVTPLREGGRLLDENAFGPYADFLVGAGLDGILAFGTNGEAVLLGVDERKRGLELWLEAVDRRGDWSILRLTAGAERYVPTRPIDPKGRDGWALDL